ncbi:phage portal protein [Pseudarthrobacter sp. alpha12b]
MGIFSRAQKVAAYSPATGYSASPDITGLFSPSTLAQAIFPDVDTSLFPVDRAAALSVPAVVRGLQIFSSLGSRLPLLATDTNGNPVDLPWLTTTEGVYSPAKRQASVIQDLILENHAVLKVERDANGFVTAAAHLPVGIWAIDADGYITIDNKRVNQDSVLYIPSLMPAGFLETAKDSVRQYRNITQTINNRTAVPEPVVLTKETQPLEATAEEIDDMRAQLQDSLTNKRGGMVHVPYGLDISGFGATDSSNSLMIQGREALRKDLANFLGITVGLLDGTNGDSNTYNNAVDERNELLELSLKTWTEAIADRLSQDDVTPPGIKVSVDYSSFRTSVAKGNSETPITEVTND